MESNSKRQRERRLIEKRREKAYRRAERAVQKQLGAPDPNALPASEPPVRDQHPAPPASSAADAPSRSPDAAPSSPTTEPRRTEPER